MPVEIALRFGPYGQELQYPLTVSMCNTQDLLCFKHLLFYCHVMRYRFAFLSRSLRKFINIFYVFLVSRFSFSKLNITLHSLLFLVLTKSLSREEDRKNVLLLIKNHDVIHIVKYMKIWRIRP